MRSVHNKAVSYPVIALNTKDLWIPHYLLGELSVSLGFFFGAKCWIANNHSEPLKIVSALPQQTTVRPIGTTNRLERGDLRATITRDIVHRHAAVRLLEIHVSLLGDLVK